MGTIPEIKRPGISQETIEKSSIRRVDAREAKTLCGMSQSGIWIPFLMRDGKPVVENGKAYGRLRLDQQLPSGQKYHQEAGTEAHAYFPVGLKQLSSESDLFIVEGEFKAISLVEAGIPAIGISGFYGWGRKVEEKWVFLNEMAQRIMETKPKRIIFIGDSDTALNFHFSDAACSLRQIARRTVLLPRIPFNGPGKGIDDCREKLGTAFSEWWESILETAVELDLELSRESLARLLCEREMEALKALEGIQEARALDRSIKLLDKLGRSPMDYSKFKSILKSAFSVNVRDLDQGVKSLRAKRIEAEQSKLTQKSDWGPVFTSTNSDEVTGKICDGEPAQRYWAHAFNQANHILFEPNESRFYEYIDKTGVWEVLNQPVLEQRIGGLLIEESRKPNGYKFLEKKTDNRYTTQIARQIQGISQKKGVFSQRKKFIHCRSSMVALENGEAVEYEFDPEFFSRNALPIDPDFTAGPDRFLNELLRPVVSEDSIELLQKFFGLWILQDNLAQQFMIFTGPGGTGKSQLVKIVDLLIGKNNVGSLRTNHLSERFEIGRMIGKSLLVGADVKWDFLEKPSASVIKAMTGGDTIDAELKQSNGMFFVEGRFNIVITCNEKLRLLIEGDAGAWRRRLAIIKFRNVPPAKETKDFARVLFEEEGPRILAWAIKGALKMFADFERIGRIEMSSEHKGLVDDLIAESQSVEKFIDENLIAAKGIGNVTRNEVTEAYHLYCSDRGWKPVSPKKLSSELSEYILTKFGISESHSIGRERSDRGWRNLSLKPKALVTVSS